MERKVATAGAPVITVLRGPAQTGAVTMIAIDRNSTYAPCCFVVCRVNTIDGSYSTRDEDGTVLIQTDWDWPQVAEQFGWQRPAGITPEEAIPPAGEYLDGMLGKVVEDPGYFP